MEDEKEERAPATKEKRRKVLAGAAALALVLLGVLLFRALTPEAKPATAAPEVGLINMEKARAAHPDYETLTDLKVEELTLELEIEKLAALPTLTVKPPEASKQPFEDSVWQKNAQSVIGSRIKLDQEKKDAEKRIREKTGEAYEAERAALDEEYLNAILNLNLKLDNQKEMHHPWEEQSVLDEERAQWEEELKALKLERGSRQAELKAKWDKEVAAAVEKELAPKMAAWEKESKDTLAQQKSAALAASTAAQNRNTGLMAQQMELSKRVQEHLQKRAELIKVKAKREALEKHIASDIAGKASKLAILHHFTLILAEPMESLSKIFPGEEALAFDVPRYGRVYAPDAVDVTEELIAELGKR